MKKENEDSNVVLKTAQESKERHDMWQKQNADKKIKEGGFCKIRFVDSEGSEWMWVKVVDQLANAVFCGELNNEPQIIKSYKIGDKIYFDFNEIADYMEWKGGEVNDNNKQ